MLSANLALFLTGVFSEHQWRAAPGGGVSDHRVSGRKRAAGALHRGSQSEVEARQGRVKGQRPIEEESVKMIEWSIIVYPIKQESIKMIEWSIFVFPIKQESIIMIEWSIFVYPIKREYKNDFDWFL